jgi:hypothetical protein
MADDLNPTKTHILLLLLLGTVPGGRPAAVSARMHD